MVDYISVAEASAKFNVSERRVQTLCEQGRIPGAKVLSGVWIIPETSEKPLDARKKSARENNQLNLFDQSDPLEDNITLEEVCKILSISLASGRNWLRLGKIEPISRLKKPLFFSRKEIMQLLEDITTSNTKVLKSRRNKKKVSGNKLYSDYVRDTTVVETVRRLIDCLPVIINEQHIRVVLANIVIQLAAQSIDQSNSNTVPIEEYLNGTVSLLVPSTLISEILGSTTEALVAIPDLIEALKIRFKKSNTDDILGFVYMSLKNVGNKKTSGAYYTPAKIVTHLLENLKKTIDLSLKTCLDPCCGSGNFLLGYAEIVDSPDNVYGQDNDELAVLLTRTNFALRYGISSMEFLKEHFTVGDSLFSLPHHQFDIIIGNPPWGYEFSEDIIRKLCQNYKSATINGTESYDLFVERAISLLPHEGILSFILPEAILNVKAHESIRSILVEQGAFSFVSYIGNVFTGVQCPAIIIGVRKGAVQGDIRVSRDGEEFIVTGKERFIADNINLRSSNIERDCLHAISYSQNKIYLKGNAIFALGIVTGNNKQMVLDSKEDGCEIILKGSDIRKYTWTSSGHYIRFKPEMFQQVAPTEYYRAPEKLLYRFICDTPVFAYDDNQTLSLNSCNILIPRIEGISIKYVLAILNSRVVDFFYRQTYNSVKLLRSHIEQIPIPIPNTIIQKQIVSATDEIISGKGQANEIFEDIDSTIMNLYELSAAEKGIIHSHSFGRNMFLS